VLFTPPPRRTLWRALGAGSVVLGLLFAVLLGLRLVRAKAVSSGTPAAPRGAEVSRVTPPAAQLAFAAAEEPGLGQSLMSLQLESEQKGKAQLPSPPGASPLSQSR
jgi:hypothetical protein